MQNDLIGKKSQFEKISLIFPTRFLTIDLQE